MLASLWHIWAPGDQIYIAYRNGGGTSKISIDSSGKLILSVGKNERWDFARPMLFPDSSWRHIVEISFLIGESILPVCDIKELKESKPALGIVTPPGQKLAVNVLTGSPPLTHQSPIPAMMRGGSIVFQHTLRGGNLLSVVARVLPMLDQDMRNMLEILSNLKVNMAGPNPSTEAMWFKQSAETGNVITIVPVGPEAFTSGVANAGMTP